MTQDRRCCPGPRTHAKSHLGLALRQDTTTVMADMQTVEQIRHDPYNLTLYIDLANQYLDLAYPDLAAGAAYKALLLSDAVADEGDEFHDQALASLNELHRSRQGDEKLPADIDALSVRDDSTDSNHNLTPDVSSVVEHHVPIMQATHDFALGFPDAL